MKNIFFILFALPVLELEAESNKETATWSSLATGKKPEGPDFEKRFRQRHFYLVSEGLCTRVPRESILHIPKKHRGVVHNKPEGKQVSWIVFLAANRNWLSHHKVTWAQVLGKVPLGEKTRQGFKDGNRLVIASYQGGPVTVLTAPKEKSKK